MADSNDSMRPNPASKNDVKLKFKIGGSHSSIEDDLEPQEPNEGWKSLFNMPFTLVPKAILKRCNLLYFPL